MTSNILTRYDHEIEVENQDHQCIYNVYVLWEGTVDGEESFCDLTEAEKFFSECVETAKNFLKSNPSQYGTGASTICLYDTVNGNMLQELCEQEIT